MKDEKKEVPESLDRITDVVINYRPKEKQPKPNKKKAKKK